ncbi:MAG: VWA domain-containing protein [Chloroflexi bacterium]|nr:VWA domain-containing protein [Chloroflexota bacterium]
MSNDPLHEERLRRWRLILGGGKADGTGMALQGIDLGMDEAMSALYDGGQDGEGKDRRGGMGDSMPNVSRWLGDIREYFPKSVVQVMQQDAIERIGLRQMLAEPDILETIEPDVHMVATLLSLSSVIPQKTKATARVLVKKLVEQLMKKLENPMREAIRGALNRASRTKNPRHHDINWNRTVITNLKHYQPQYKTVIPEVMIGYGRRRSQLRDVIICIDQSGSMATSVVYSSIFGAVMASIPALKTHLVVFDTSVVDLTHELHDPVEIMFGTQLGGGTNIEKALGYCQQLIMRPEHTIVILISDLYEGGDRDMMLQRVGQIVNSGVQMVALLALNDDGAPSFDRRIAAELATLDVPAFAVTPDLFPELMATALNRRDIALWAAKNDIQVARGEEE